MKLSQMPVISTCRRCGIPLNVLIGTFPVHVCKGAVRNMATEKVDG